MLDTYLRPEVIAFAIVMEYRLRLNDYKGTWKECSLTYLLTRCREELDELLPAVTGVCPAAYEAADVANFAMMIADKYGYLQEAVEYINARIS